MIDTRKLKELVRLMVENDLSELDLRDHDETVTIKRGGAGVPMVHYAPPAAMMPAGTPRASAAAASEDDAPAAPDESSLIAVESPMVGTFYSKPTPDAESFVSVGASIGSDTVVCLIEAMKVFNEIKAEVSGTVERVLVKDGESVEFGQKLYLVRPA
jgi:acetyl-CoA carboxylase biotin carboxyl carrier protein